jgi:(R)-2-hydroxyacyl-CoA dehydratese activating ATPase
MKDGHYLGLDIGSTSTQAVFITMSAGTVRVRARAWGPTGADGTGTAERLRREVCGGVEPALTVATGYGRRAVRADRALTEITCLALGARELDADAVGGLDVGGQDAKFVWIDPRGRCAGFALNDRCAAGTGRFLELAARICELPLDEWDALELPPPDEPGLSATCGVFAESELVGRLAAGEDPRGLVGAAARSIAGRLTALPASAGRPPADPSHGMLLAGGVAENGLAAAALIEAFAVLGLPLRRTERPAFVTARGAALAAVRLHQPDSQPTSGR